jgi:predicted nucleotidyltransferase
VVANAVEAARAVSRHCAAHPEVLAATLFGSAASGALRPASDIDVAFLLDATVAPDAYLRYRLEAMAALEEELGRRVDVVLLNEAPPLLRYEVFRGGLVVENHAPAAIRDPVARTLLEWFDFEPLFRRLTSAAIDRLRAHAHG